MTVLDYLAQLKKDLGLAFGAHFLHDISIKIFLFNTLSMGRVSILNLIPSSRYQTKYVIKFLFRSLMTL